MSEVNTDKKGYYLTKESFNKLVQIQNRVTDEADMSPSFRRLVNTIIEEVNIDDIVIHAVKTLAVD